MSQTQIKRISNPILDMVEIKAQIANLKKAEAKVKERIANLMDGTLTDKLVIGSSIALRSIIVQERLNASMAKEMLGDDAPMREVEQIRWVFE